MDMAKVTDINGAEMKAPEVFPGFAVDRSVLERQRGIAQDSDAPLPT